MVHSSLCGPHVLICMPDNVGAPNEKMDGDLGNLLLAYSCHMRSCIVVHCCVSGSKDFILIPNVSHAVV